MLVTEDTVCLKCLWFTTATDSNEEEIWTTFNEGYDGHCQFKPTSPHGLQVRDATGIGCNFYTDL